MKKFNTNWIGLFILVTAWSYAAVRFTAISRDIAAEKDPDGGKRSSGFCIGNWSPATATV